MTTIPFTKVPELDLDFIKRLEFKDMVKLLDQYNVDIYSLILKDYITRDQFYKNRLLEWFFENFKQVPQNVILEIIGYLIEKGGDIDYIIQGKTILYTLLFEDRNIELAKFLLDRVDKREKGGLLLEGIENVEIEPSDISGIELLLKYEADVNFDYGEPLSMAVENNNIELARFLIDHGADVNIEEGKFLLGTSDPKMAQLLIDNGADIRVRDYQALRDANEKGDTELVEVLERGLCRRYQ